MKNIIFLDFDGVLNNNFDSFSEYSIKTLKILMNKNKAKVVVISSYLENGTLKIRKK